MAQDIFLDFLNDIRTPGMIFRLFLKSRSLGLNYLVLGGECGAPLAVSTCPVGVV